MKRILFLFFVLISLSQARASDTLTIRQVFNFNVGDTFDYYIHSNNIFSDGTQNSSYNYERILITGKSFSLDSETVVYTREMLYPFINIDTIKYSALDSPIIYIDSIYSYLYYSFSISIDSDSITTNTLLSSSTDYLNTQTYMTGLGETHFQINNGNPAYGSTENDTTLIYYAKGSLIRGTPYYDQYAFIHLGLKNTTNPSSISVYPNPSSDELHLSLSDAEQFNTQLIITDILGQEVYSSIITQSESTHDISKLTSGIYTWRVIENNAIIKTGKVVKE